jgi:polyisoprenoid-binding protein YceI
MRIEANNARYDIELKKQDFETQVEKHEEITKIEEGVDKS